MLHSRAYFVIPQRLVLSTSQLATQRADTRRANKEGVELKSLHHLHSHFAPRGSRRLRLPSASDGQDSLAAAQRDPLHFLQRPALCDCKRGDFRSQHQQHHKPDEIAEIVVQRRRARLEHLPIAVPRTRQSLQPVRPGLFSSCALVLGVTSRRHCQKCATPDCAAFHLHHHGLSPLLRAPDFPARLLAPTEP
jgi:hypothetical protein